VFAATKKFNSANKLIQQESFYNRQTGKETLGDVKMSGSSRFTIIIASLLPL